MNDARTPIGLLLVMTLGLAPFVGVGTLVVSTGRPVGVGVQPAFLAGGLLLLILAVEGARAHRAPPAPLLGALLWTALGVVLAWRLDHLGLSGEYVWEKATKQLVLLVFFAGLAIAPAYRLARTTHPFAELRRWERACTAGLAVAAGVGLLQVVDFYAPTSLLEAIGGFFRSNPSIASGSEELYLGHRFVGIPRVAGPACEPLYFGSYLLVAVPVALLGATAQRGLARLWRLVAAAAGAACLILGFSRGAFLGVGVLLGLAWLGQRRGVLPAPRRGRTLVTALAVLTGIAAVSALGAGVAPWTLPRLLLDRLAQSFQGHDMSNLTRLYAWKAAFAAFLQHPIAGVGWGAFGFHYFPLAGAAGAGAHFGWPMTNSIPLRFLAETGLVGVVLWGWAARPTVSSLRRPEPGPPSRGDALAYILAAVVVALLAQGLTFSQLQLPHLWLTAGVSAAIHHERHRLV